MPEQRSMVCGSTAEPANSHWTYGEEISQGKRARLNGQGVMPEQVGDWQDGSRQDRCQQAGQAWSWSASQCPQG